MESEMNLSEHLFTDVYLKFTEMLSHGEVREEDAKIHVPEKTIRCVWNDQLFKKKILKTTGGRDLEVIFPGYWNFGKGPDFKSCAIKVDGKLYEGDVEIHVYATDWKAHNHLENPDYDQVVLHVFLWNDRTQSPLAEDSEPKPSGFPGGLGKFELELKSFLSKGILELNDELDFDNYPVLNQFNYGACHRPLARLSKEKLIHLLNVAGDARIFTKMDRYHDRVIVNGYEQTFYEGVAEALGYPVNKRAFQTLAEKLPLDLIKQIVPPKASKKEKVFHVQALLFGVAGLIDFKSLDTASLPEDERSYFEKIHKLWEKYRPLVPAEPMKASIWKFGGIRPANFPYRRIAGLAHLLVRHWSGGMFEDYQESFRAALTHSGNKGYTVKIKPQHYHFFCVEADDYWAYHYTAGGKTLKSTQQLVGNARSREITINILIPIGLIHARASRSTELEAAFNMLFQSRKGPSDNKLIRFMKHYIFGNNEEMIKALSTDKQVQGLMQVYQDFCTQTENNCLRCQFPDIVKRYFK